MRAVYKYWAALVFVGVLLQVALAGVGAFLSAEDAEDETLNSDGFEDNFGLHLGVGYLVVLASLVLLIIAAVARKEGANLKWSAILFGLFVLQVVLAWIGEGVGALGFLHPLNALVLFTISGWLTRAAWAGDTERVTPAV